MIMLDHDRRCPWVQIAQVTKAPTIINMQTEHGETFLMKTEGQYITSGYPTLREAIQRTFPTLV